MSTRITARNAFAIAIGLLLVCAVLIYSTLADFANSERRVNHTQQVRELLGETESDIASAARARLIYVFNGDDDSLAQYQRSVAQIPIVLKQLRQLTADNPTQQLYCARLENSVNTRIQLWEKSVALKKSGAREAAGQPQMTRQSVEFANDIVAVTRAMRAEESRLLEQRTARAHLHFMVLLAVVFVTFSSAVLLLVWHYRLLRAELHAREQAEESAGKAAAAALESERKANQAERAALASREAARRLNTRLLQLRDDERRKFSRELHDSLGQYLAATKMLLSSLAAGNDTDPRYAECIKLLDQSIKETRTISHLLHPPGLDEAGFSSAARWYAEEFAKRSGLELKINVPEPPSRMSPELELALFRVLQEGLTNIHRHSKSKSAEVSFDITPEQATLLIADHGVGVPTDVLDRFNISGTSGVGLAGMRERIRELGGRFEVESNDRGTRVRVTVSLVQVQALAADVNR
jgi:signal transduction histidine kinase